MNVGVPRASFSADSQYAHLVAVALPHDAWVGSGGSMPPVL